jgi:glutamyl-tRNA reductase
MNKLEGIFVYDIDDLQTVAASHLADRAREAKKAEALIAGEVERFHQRQRAVNVAPAIVALQRQAEELRQTELRRIQARLGTLTAEQAAAVEALTRGLVNKFLHPPMQALKQAARENDSARVDALCDVWSLPGVSGRETGAEIDPELQNSEASESSKPAKDVAVTQSSGAGRG